MGYRESHKKCNKCHYWSRQNGCYGTCDYMLETGHARILICPPGEDCTVFKPRKANRKPNPMRLCIPVENPDIFEKAMEER